MIHWLNSNRPGELEPATFDEHRSPFEVDADKVVYSDAFRRLQDKTQVHGLCGSDYIRTRLTHSMEASRIGRSLGNATGDAILGAIGADGGHVFDADDVSHVVLAATLAHDLGNPPWGHTGEDVISGFFTRHDLGRRLCERLPAAMRHEVANFEGNAQGFRILTRLGGWRNSGGLKLSAATLAAFTKYPFAATSARSTAKKNKYGFFASEAGIFGEVAEATGMIAHPDGGWCRHPLSHLVEAADDIAYLIADLEDGVVLGLVPFAEAERMLEPIAGCVDDLEYRQLSDDHSRLLCLRSRAIKQMVAAVGEVVKAEVAGLLDGTHPGDLVQHTPHGGHLAEIRRYSVEQIYRSPQRIETDLRGNAVLSRILEMICGALDERERAGGQTDAQIRRVISLVPAIDDDDVGAERWVPKVLDHVSSLSDRAALTLARTFGGV